jgi:anti-anti-sigma regulatory factor
VLARRLAEVLAGKPQRLVFDLARVGFLDCGTARLLAGSGRYLPGQARPVIRSPAPMAGRMLAVTGLDASCEVVS